MRVMVVEDDENLRVAVAAQLRGAGLEVDTAPDIPTADRAFTATTYACVVFDRMLDGLDAIDYVQHRRSLGWTAPVLFLTARDTVHDRVAGFAHGGDDYLVKPFAIEELTARVLKLCHRAGAGRPTVLRHADLEVDCIRHEVRRAGVLLSLSGLEFAVLEYLAAHAGQVVTRADLIEHCWDDEPMANVVEAVIKRLRRKLHGPELIHTVHGHGYRLGSA
ncbi:response regulator transcription factor [Saccharothrix sp. S26]|uniref:response regulator transcription factor n=1 Tax=Saccharothrix sp. S26 TaxID=2907215 RepID=UPI001F34A2D5|nr:response regulator transcription factor [Saccharothrix sp. S26]MCE6996023.1 response regulator transcription factor [Saccharothrix sp. S26]